MPVRPSAGRPKGTDLKGFPGRDGGDGRHPPGDGRGDEPESQELTPRERTVLRLLVDGKRNLEISEELGISERTVKFHVHGLFTKLGASSRTQVVSQALRRGLV